MIGRLLGKAIAGRYVVSRFGWSWPHIPNPWLWWHYDLSTGLATAWVHQNRTGRFYGIRIGNCLIGVTWSRKEHA